MRYIITINTDSYKPMPANEKSWEKGTINDYMKALNGYKVTERSLKLVKRRIKLFCGRTYPEKNETVKEIFDWLDNPKNKTKITFRDSYCGFERTERVAAYGFAQGGFNIEKVLTTLKETGVATIPFERLYDTRQKASKLFKGCYMQIVTA